MATHYIELLPNSAACLDELSEYWQNTRWTTTRNCIVSSGLGLMSVVSEVRRSGGELFAGEQRRKGTPKTLEAFDPSRQDGYVGEEGTRAVAILELELDDQAEMDLSGLCANVGRDGLSRPRAAGGVVREAIWSARWMKDLSVYNYRVKERERWFLWIDGRPGSADLSARDRWTPVTVQQLFTVPMVERPRTPSPPYPYVCPTHVPLPMHRLTPGYWFTGTDWVPRWRWDGWAWIENR